VFHRSTRSITLTPAYPQITLDLDFTDKLVNVIEDGFDVVVRTGESIDSRLTARILSTFSLQLVAAPAYLQKDIDHD
jgi:DNA-binding transcriptional LysR family regulator